VTVFAASGDKGSSACLLGDSTAAVQDPVSSPFVTAVAAGQFSADSVADSDVVTWNSSEQAGGGGESSLFASASYQSSGAKNRQLPDLAYLADPNKYQPALLVLSLTVSGPRLVVLPRLPRLWLALCCL
jgi:subtilase family serine protease